ncbi:class I SAM-dependent methyltransferase [Bacillus dakarensis]|uniref:class I SAM-dependent methyltransferase n=1 Tax=Robertmurraya dakarensis TaxID=1926278 RepID=UPI0009825AF0|nr:methyltransferase domain-containing protein [Bacillus dakarensis]
MNSREKWNGKYQERLNDFKQPNPNTRLTNLSNYLKGGFALDLACGLGGNSLFLAGQGYAVDAIDISDVAITYLKEHTEVQNLSITAKQCDLTNLDSLNFQNEFYDLAVITYYLDRKIFPYLKTLIKENGYIFIETFYLAEENKNEHISNEYKLQPQELLREFSDWLILYYEENEQDGRQTIFCKKSQK